MFCRDLQGHCGGFLQYLQGKSCNIYIFSLQFLQFVNIAGKICKYYRIFHADIAENPCRVPVNPWKHLECSTFDESFFKFKCLNVQSAVLRVESKASSRARLFISLCLAVPQSVVRASNGANPICIQSLAVLLLL